MLLCGSHGVCAVFGPLSVPRAGAVAALLVTSALVAAASIVIVRHRGLCTAGSFVAVVVAVALSPLLFRPLPSAQVPAGTSHRTVQSGTSNHTVQHSNLTDDRRLGYGLWHRTVPGKPLKRVVWLHVPKTGSTIAQIIFRAACRVQVHFLEPGQLGDMNKYCPAGTFQMFSNGHAPLSPGLQLPLNDTFLKITILRSPARRIVSGFYHSLHDCRHLQQAYGLAEGGGIQYDPHTRAFYRNATIKHVREYANCVSGCAARMLTGFRCGDAVHPPDVARAVRVLRSFAFVGITDEWITTVEVFARHFGIRVVEKDLSKGRSGPRPHAWVDSAVEAMAPFDDDAVFVEGVSMLAASVLRDSAQYAALTRLISRHSHGPRALGQGRF